MLKKQNRFNNTNKFFVKFDNRIRELLAFLLTF